MKANFSLTTQAKLKYLDLNPPVWILNFYFEEGNKIVFIFNM